jgi:hypothetical protein
MRDLLLTAIFLVVTTTFVQAQCTINSGNSYQFTADLTPLTTLPGSATAAYYSYFWEFGDGTYSRDENPDHYFAITPPHEVLLHNGGSYSEGGRPGVKRNNRCSPIPNGIIPSANSYDIISSGNLGAELGLNAGGNIVISNETVPLMLAYRNTSSAAINGNLYLYYNDDSENLAFSIENLARTHHGETVSETIPNNGTYENSLGWAFEDLEPNMENRIFLDVLTLDTMQSRHTLRMVFVPDNSSLAAQTYDFDLVTARAYDPNKIVGNRKEKCLCRTQKYDYKVHFENEGKGAANTVKITVKDLEKNWDIESFDFQTAQIFKTEIPRENIDFFMDEKSETITITLNNVFLAGENEADRTKEKRGFVAFSIEPKKHWQPSKSEASIIFDTNEPIITPRKAKIFPKACPYFGVKGGLNDVYNFPNGETTTNNFFIGGQFGWRTKRNYFYQVEAMYAQGNLMPLVDTTSSNFVAINGLDSIAQNIRTVANAYQRIDLVPIHIGKRFGNQLNIGLGYQLSYFLKNDQTSQETINTFYRNQNNIIEAIARVENNPIPIQADFSPFETQIFADINYNYKIVGLGIRYHYGMTGERFKSTSFSQRSNLQVYALLQF